MTDTKIGPGGTVKQPIDLVTGRDAVPLRLIGATPTAQHAALASGNQHLALPEWTSGAGPMIFQIQGNASTSNLTGMGGKVADVQLPEWVAIVGTLISLVNISANAVTTTANDAASPAGSRFAAAVSILAGTCQIFVCADVAGEKKWFPVAYASAG